MTDLLKHLRERKIVQWTLVYLAGAWLALQVLDTISDNFGWSPLIMRAVIVLLAMGCIAAMVIAWYHGERGHQRVGGVEMGILIAVLIVAAAAVTLVLRKPANATNASNTTSTPDLASVAVLPFVDMSQEKNQEFFGDGITEEILNVLAKVPGLRVPGRTSSFSFKGKEVSITDIAKQLNVAHILEGSVRKSGHQLRVTAQLIDARSDRHVWSETYDRNDTDLFAVQDEIAQAIVDALRLHVGGSQDTTLVAMATSNPRAHELYLQGLYQWHRRHLGKAPAALAAFEEAARLDPNYARAYAGIALAHAVLPQYEASAPREVSIKAGREAAAKALVLDPHAADAHAALGQIAGELEWNWVEAEKQLREALREDPKYANAHQWLSETYLVQGKFNEALNEIDRALELEPLSPVMVNLRAYGLMLSGRVKEAEDLFSDLLAADSAYLYPRVNLIRLFVSQKRYDEALALANQPRIREVIMAAKDTTRREQAARKLGEPAARFAGAQSMHTLAFLYNALGMPDSAASVLDQAAARWEPSLAYAAHDRSFANLRSLPAFQDFLRKLHL